MCTSTRSRGRGWATRWRYRHKQRKRGHPVSTEERRSDVSQSEAETGTYKRICRLDVHVLLLLHRLRNCAAALHLSPAVFLRSPSRQYDTRYTLTFNLCTSGCTTGKTNASITQKRAESKSINRGERVFGRLTIYRTHSYFL